MIRIRDVIDVKWWATLGEIVVKQHKEWLILIIDSEVAYNNTSAGQQRNETNIILGDYTVSLRFIEIDNISSTIVRITRFDRLIFYRKFMNEKNFFF